MNAQTRTETTKGLRITLKRSPIGTPVRHRLVLRGLGLRRMHQTVVRPDTDQVKGMIRKVGYLLEVNAQ
ncbi:MAG: 50S ribosomal protein L30 [Nitrospiraceae bacterium]